MLERERGRLTGRKLGSQGLRETVRACVRRFSSENAVFEEVESFGCACELLQAIEVCESVQLVD